MGFFIFIVVVGVVIFNIVKNSKATREQWRVAAGKLGLGYYVGDLGAVGTIHGVRNGHRVRISTFTKNSGNSSSAYTKYRVDFHERIPVGFRITRQKGAHRLGKVFGMQDIEVGDPSFDDRAIIQGSFPDRVRAFLTPERRDAIRHALISYKDVVITNEHIEINKPGKDADAAVIIHTARVLLSLSEVLIGTEAKPAAEPAAAPAKEPPPPIFEPVEPAANPLFPANPVVPDPPMVEVEEPLEELLEEPAPEPAPVAAVEDLKTIAADLYARDAGAAMVVAKRFAEVYQGRRVIGSGTLRRVRKFSYDPVFTNTKGVKATVDICELAGTYSKIKVGAEVCFAAEEYDALKLKEGTAISISGTLTAQDGAMHQFYVVSD